MINLDELNQSPTPIEVEPSDNIFTELGKNTYDYKDLLSELIDNSIAAARNAQKLKVSIDLYIDHGGKAVEFIYKDNAAGIPP